ncbi:WapI family immunity protein [Methylomonas sp. HW2-6]|uniref:WapI family immunity protein n=1 Tax=Methylomonas sp. HW2-6 TaxID=3376687 RepID=UPI0040429569
MEVPLVEDVSVHSVNGAVVVLRVRSNGYSGMNDLWVHAPDLKAFASALVQLERSLRGEARLASMSPNELELRVYAASSTGHLAVHGTIGQLVKGENQSCWHSVTFGFEFELGQLSNAISEPWVRQNVA